MAKTMTITGTSGSSEKPTYGAAPRRTRSSYAKTTGATGYRKTPGALDAQNVYERAISGGEEARAATEKGFGEAKNIYEQITSLFAPGGQYGAGMEAQLGRAKKQAVASGSQALVSSGLYGTTQAAGLGKKFEEEVGVPARERTERERVGKYAQALGGQAGLLERREDEGPDYKLIASLMQQIYGA